MARKISLLYFVLAFLAATTMVFGQGVQSSTLEGKVLGPDGAGLPGVTITVSSPALMGERTAVTEATGSYVVRGLPPGNYTVRFALEGMQTIERKMTLTLGTTSEADAQMKVTAVAEAITVTASSPTVLENTTVGANIKNDTVQELPVGRTPTGIGSLAASVTGDRGGRTTTPVAGQLSINGGMAYDNNFLIDGVNVQDNIFGQTNNLFIEDAIQETQVLTSGISAEYGHFTGGVLNVITKSGGNTFTGSVRDDLTKPSWTALTPFEEGFRGNGVASGPKVPHTGKLSNVYEATLGGPIVRDRLWFFLAGRDQKTDTPINLPVTGYSPVQTTTNRRPEVKLTGNLGSSHTLQVDYIDNPLKRNFDRQVTPIDTTALAPNPEQPNHGYSAFYSGVLTSNLFAEARYSSKVFEFKNSGGTSTNIVDSPMRTLGKGGTTSGTFNAPYFDATDPEHRNNTQVFGALSYFLSKPGWGSHDIKGGFENFVDTRDGGNSQTSTNYVFYTPYAVSGGSPVLDANGHLIPVFNPLNSTTGADGSYTAIGNWLATRGAKLDITTNSLFVNDRWNLNNHWSFNLGARYEKVKSKATGDIVAVDSSAFVPRLGASFDPLANGKYKIDVTYAKYAGRYNPALAGANSDVGNPALLYGYYTGPAGQGRDFAPGFDPANYVFYYASVPTGNVFVANGLHSPVNNEFTVSGGMALPKGGWAKLTFTDRKLKNVIEDFITIDNGCSNIVFGGIDAGCFDNIVYRNSSGPKRDYQAIALQSHYDFTRAWGVEGNWTHQLKNDGNYEGEGGQGIGTSPFGNYPEMQSPRELPVGHLAQYEADRVRLWTTYNFNLHSAGVLSAGLLFRYDSPQTFSFTASVPRSAQSKALNPGYKDASNNVTIYFGDRGVGTFNSSSLFDLSLQYSIPVAGRVTPWVKFDVTNVLNDKTQLSWNTSITADPNSSKDNLGYPTGYVKRSTFGTPTSANSYVQPRQYLVYAGVRF
ncbi:MAG TPA: TonB-dependent receptor [Thermoanaerobaculia bacterium]|nr:TonB-dependent receptor [Thermoanaerobaculia bacterium]